MSRRSRTSGSCKGNTEILRRVEGLEHQILDLETKVLARLPASQ